MSLHVIVFCLLNRLQVIAFRLPNTLLVILYFIWLVEIHYEMWMIYLIKIQGKNDINNKGENALLSLKYNIDEKKSFLRKT